MYGRHAKEVGLSRTEAGDIRGREVPRRGEERRERQAKGVGEEEERCGIAARIARSARRGPTAKIYLPDAREPFGLSDGMRTRYNGLTKD